MLTHVLPNEAINLIMSQPCRRSTETNALDKALDRVLAETIYAKLSLPSFRKSPFDGYAYRTSDVPGFLRVIGTVTAGTQELPDIRIGEAVKIFTGAPVPPSADAVVKLEDVRQTEEGIYILKTVAPGTNVILVGEDMKQGDLLIPSGTRLQPAHIGELAGQGIPEVKVFSRPKAVICPTGSELFQPGDNCSPFGIYNSSSYVLSAYLSRMGFQIICVPPVPDEATLILAAVKTALSSDADVVFTTGGASIGDYDFAAKTAQAIGAETLFWKVKMKPGGALLVSSVNSKLLVSLSGNPAAALMSLLFILRPWLMCMTGSEDRAEMITLPLRDNMPKTSTVVRLLRGHLDFAGGVVSFAEHEGRGNGNITSFAHCELLGIIPPSSDPLRRGDLIKVLRLPPDLC